MIDVQRKDTKLVIGNLEKTHPKTAMAELQTAVMATVPSLSPVAVNTQESLSLLTATISTASIATTPTSAATAANTDAIATGMSRCDYYEEDSLGEITYRGTGDNIVNATINNDDENEEESSGVVGLDNAAMCPLNVSFQHHQKPCSNTYYHQHQQAKLSSFSTMAIGAKTTMMSMTSCIDDESREVNPTSKIWPLTCNPFGYADGSSINCSVIIMEDEEDEAGIRQQPSSSPSSLDSINKGETKLPSMDHKENNSEDSNVLWCQKIEFSELEANNDDVDVNNNEGEEEAEEEKEEEEEEREERILREEEESIALARQMMAEEAMASHRMSADLLRENASQFSPEDFHALQAALNEEETEPIMYDPTDNQEEEDDSLQEEENLSYEALIQLGERIGDVKSDRWAMVAKDVIQKLEVVHYDPTNSIATTMVGCCEDSFTNDTELKCLVCQFPYERNAVLRKLPCGHCFHLECVDRWLMEKDICPYCRQSIVEK